MRIDHARDDGLTAGVDDLQAVCRPGISLRVGRSDPADASALDQDAVRQSARGRPAVGDGAAAIEDALRCSVATVELPPDGPSPSPTSDSRGDTQRAGPKAAGDGRRGTQAEHSPACKPLPDPAHGVGHGSPRGTLLDFQRRPLVTRAAVRRRPMDTCPDHPPGRLAVIVIGGILIYNGLVQRRLRIDEAFAQIEVQLKRRWDLIPNLVNAVKGYMGFEQSVLENVTQARANAVTAGAQRPGRAGRRRERADRHAALAVRSGRELSRAEGQPERARAAGAADDDREPDRLRAPALQRCRARLQHVDRDRPQRAHRRAPSASEQARVLRRRARGGAGPAGRLSATCNSPSAAVG